MIHQTSLNLLSMKTTESEAEKLGLVTPRDIKKPVSQASGLPNDDDSTTTKGQKVPDAQK